ncbi:MAG: DUF2007 domain-containing protein [Saccharospirillaceae bacterium]|nr:DUF2007 domain-containing protein [Pseudomonadales bacterium]NRB79977.1 DUF2007 domain-containing protein [Saccharospirillaceae bacterium]
MKLLYEAANSVEAHMIVNLLEQSDLSARIDGEFLQGGAGDLQAFGVVRVMIEEHNYDNAVAVINLWESMAPKIDEEDRNSVTLNTVTTSKLHYIIIGLVLGFICGVAVTLLSY